MKLEKKVEELEKMQDENNLLTEIRTLKQEIETQKKDEPERMKALFKIFLAEHVSELDQLVGRCCLLSLYENFSYTQTMQLCPSSYFL